MQLYTLDDTKILEDFKIVDVDQISYYKCKKCRNDNRFYDYHDYKKHFEDVHSNRCYVQQSLNCEICRQTYESLVDYTLHKSGKYINYSYGRPKFFE
jgi:hypothetical protein